MMSLYVWSSFTLSQPLFSKNWSLNPLKHNSPIDVFSNWESYYVPEPINNILFAISNTLVLIQTIINVFSSHLHLPEELQSFSCLAVFLTSWPCDVLWRAIHCKVWNVKIAANKQIIEYFSKATNNDCPICDN